MPGAQSIFDDLHGLENVIHLTKAQTHSLVSLVMAVTFPFDADALRYICRNDRRSQTKSLLLTMLRATLSSDAFNTACCWLFRAKEGGDTPLFYVHEEGAVGRKIPYLYLSLQHGGTLPHPTPACTPERPLSTYVCAQTDRR